MLTFVAIALLLGATIADPVEDYNPSPCCVPKQWSGTLGSVTGSVSGGKPSTMNQTIMEFYDYDKMKVALVGNGFRTVEDYNKGVSYSIVSNQCTTSKLVNSLFNCIPANATFLGSYQYGGPKGLKVNDYSIDSFSPGLIGRISFTAGSCLPVLETVIHGGTDAYIGAIGFVNIVPSIKDPSVFDVPSPPCPKDTDLNNFVDMPKRQGSIFARLP